MQKRAKKAMCISLSTVERDALIELSQQNAVSKLAPVEHFAETADFNCIRTLMYIQLRLRKRDGDFWLENLYLKALLLCSMLERYSL